MNHTFCFSVSDLFVSFKTSFVYTRACFKKQPFVSGFRFRAKGSISRRQHPFGYILLAVRIVYPRALGVGSGLAMVAYGFGIKRRCRLAENRSINKCPI